MKITEAMRRKKSWEMIHEIAEDASANSGSKADEALNSIYRIAHTMGTPKCRKNHANWIKPIDAAIRAGERNKI